MEPAAIIQTCLPIIVLTAALAFALLTVFILLLAVAFAFSLNVSSALCGSALQSTNARGNSFGSFLQSRQVTRLSPTFDSENLQFYDAMRCSEERPKRF